MQMKTNWLQWWKFQDYLRITRTGVGDELAVQQATVWRGFLSWLMRIRIYIHIKLYLKDNQNGN